MSTNAKRFFRLGVFVMLELLLVVASYMTLLPIAEAATTTVRMQPLTSASSTSQYRFVGLRPTTSCSYQLGQGNQPGVITVASGVGGGCNTNDFLNPDNSIRVDPNFDSPIESNVLYTGWIQTASISYAISPFYWNGSIFVGVVPNTPEINYSDEYNTRFDDLDVIESAPNDFRVDVVYYLDSTERDPNQANRNAQDILFQYETMRYDPTTKRPTGTTTESSNFLLGQLPLVEDTVFTDNSTIPSMCFSGDADGTVYRTELIARYYNQGSQITGIYPFPEAYILLTYYSELSSGDCILSTQGPSGGQDLEVYSSLNTETLQREPCGITAIDGCITNSVRALFIPQNTTIEEIFTVDQQLSTKIPFVYLTEISTVADEFLNSPMTQSLDINLSILGGTIILIDRNMIANAPYVNLLNTLITGALWVLFAMVMYRIALGIHNRETT